MHEQLECEERNWERMKYFDYVYPSHQNMVKVRPLCGIYPVNFYKILDERSWLMQIFFCTECWQNILFEHAMRTLVQTIPKLMKWKWTWTSTIFNKKRSLFLFISLLKFKNNTKDVMYSLWLPWTIVVHQKWPKFAVSFSATKSDCRIRSHLHSQTIEQFPL